MNYPLQKELSSEQLSTLGALSFAFVFGGICGWICEIIVGYFNNGYVDLEHGGIGIPFLTIYAVGAVACEMLFKDTELTPHNVMRVFVITGFIALIIEYSTGLIMLNMFDVQTWDYRRAGWNWLFVTPDGLVSARGLISFGLLGLIQVFVIDRIRMRLQEKYERFDRASLLMMIVVALYVCTQYITGSAVMR